MFVKDVLIPKIIDAPLLEKYGVLEYFDKQKWCCLLVDDKPMYPLVVRQFYASLMFSHSTRTLKSFVKGRDIVLDDSFLVRILNIPNKG